MRLKLFQGVLVNYKIAGRELCEQNVYKATSGITVICEGKDAKHISQIRPTIDL